MKSPMSVLFLLITQPLLGSAQDGESASLSHSLSQQPQVSSSLSISTTRSHTTTSTSRTSTKNPPSAIAMIPGRSRQSSSSHSTAGGSKKASHTINKDSDSGSEILHQNNTLQEFCAERGLGPKHRALLELFLLKSINNENELPEESRPKIEKIKKLLEQEKKSGGASTSFPSLEEAHDSLQQTNFEALIIQVLLSHNNHLNRNLNNLYRTIQIKRKRKKIIIGMAIASLLISAAIIYASSRNKELVAGTISSVESLLNATKDLLQVIPKKDNTIETIEQNLHTIAKTNTISMSLSIVVAVWSFMTIFTVLLA